MCSDYNSYEYARFPGHYQTPSYLFSLKREVSFYLFSISNIAIDSLQFAVCRQTLKPRSFLEKVLANSKLLMIEL